jgi:hypothetical protein
LRKVSEIKSFLRHKAVSSGAIARAETGESAGRRLKRSFGRVQKTRHERGERSIFRCGFADESDVSPAQRLNVYRSERAFRLYAKV